MTTTAQPEQRRKDLIVWTAFIFLMLAWGSSFILVKRGLTVFPPLTVAALRLSAAMCVLAPFAVRHAFKIERKQWLPLFCSALLGVFFPAYLFALAQMGLNSSITGVLNALTPLMTFVLGVVLFRQKSNHYQLAGLLLGFLGSVTLILVNVKGELSLNSYALLVVVATLCYGLNLNLVKRFLSDVSPIHLSTVSVLVSGLLSLLYLITTPWWSLAQTPEIGWSALLAVLALGFFGTALAQLFFNRMLQLSTAVFASSITYFIPIVAVLWGVWDGEVLMTAHYFGMVLIIGGILILNRFK